MRVKVLFVCLLLSSLIFASSSGARTARETVSFEGQVRGVEFSKAVPGLLNYQGYLADASDSSAVTATLGMTFRLFDSETKGAELWSETHPAVDVANGLFDVHLGSATPFAPGLFDGTPMWLQTEIGAEVLSPRKPLVSVAYSHRANSAEKLLGFALPDLDDRWVNEGQAGSVTSDMVVDGHSSGLDADMVDGQHAAEFAGPGDLDHLDAADGDPLDAVYVNNDGQVGIGTTTPMYPLDVNGAVNAATYHGDGSNLTGIVGAPDADWTIMGNNIYSGVSGNVGIGTAAPTEKLHIVGSSGNYAIIAGPTYGVYGRHTANNKYGYLGGSYGAYGEDFGTGNSGYLGGDNYGVYGSSAAGHAGYFMGNGYFSGDVGIGTTSPGEELHVDGLFPQIQMHQPGMGASFFTVGAGAGGFSFDDHLYNEPFFFPYGTPTATLNADTSGGITLGEWGPAIAGLEIFSDIDDFELGLTELDTDMSDHAQMFFDSDQGDWNLGVNSGTGIFYLYNPNSMWDAFRAFWNADSSEYEIDLNDDVFVSGDFLVSGAKSFVQEDPTDPSRAIVYACLEGPEAGTYQRGTEHLVGGRTTIELPDHFAKVTVDQDLTVQLTPVGEWLQLYVVEKSPSRIVVAEASGREGSFDYLIQGVRRGYQDYQVVRSRDEIPGLNRQINGDTTQGGSRGTESRMSTDREVNRRMGNKSPTAVGRGAEE